MRIFFLFAILWFASSLTGQPNCNVFLWNGDTLQYRACKLVEENSGKYYQFSADFQAIMHEAIAICPYFAYPYREIAAPYIKSGHFVEWKKYMDKAVLYAPRDYLPVRASLRYKFFADYAGTLEDIAVLDTLMVGDIGYTSNGTYHLNIVRGLCLKATGQKAEAIAVIEKQLAKDMPIGLFDYLHLGVLYLETGALDSAIQSFETQAKENNLAENNYYLALCYKQQQDEKRYADYLAKAKQLYQEDQRMHDPYHHLFDQIYWSDIEQELQFLKKAKN